MRLRCRPHFLTLVLSLCLASHSARTAPTTDIPPDGWGQAPRGTEPSQPLEKDSLGITPLPPPDRDAPLIAASRVVRERTVNVMAGLWSGKFDDGDSNQTQVLGVGITDQNSDESAWDYGLDLSAGGLFGAYGRYKSYCCMGRWSEPYWTVGLEGIYKPWDLLAGFIKIDSYQVQAGLGLEDLFGAERRWRTELLAGAGTRGALFQLRVGYAFDEDFLSF